VRICSNCCVKVGRSFMAVSPPELLKYAIKTPYPVICKLKEFLENKVTKTKQKHVKGLMSRSVQRHPSSLVLS